MVKGHLIGCGVDGHSMKISRCHIMWLLLIVPTYSMILRATVPTVGSATTSFNDLVTVTQENSTNHTEDVLVDQLQCLGLGK